MTTQRIEFHEIIKLAIHYKVMGWQTRSYDEIEQAILTRSECGSLLEAIHKLNIDRADPFKFYLDGHKRLMWPRVNPPRHQWSTDEL